MFNKYANARQSINYSQPPLHSWCAGKIKSWLQNLTFECDHKIFELRQAKKNFHKLGKIMQRGGHIHICVWYIYKRYNIPCLGTLFFICLNLGAFPFQLLNIQMLKSTYLVEPWEFPQPRFPCISAKLMKCLFGSPLLLWRINKGQSWQCWEFENITASKNV